MPTSFMKKTMVYLGLVDDDYDEYDDYDDRAPRVLGGSAPGPRVPDADELEEPTGAAPPVRVSGPSPSEANGSAVTPARCTRPATARRRSGRCHRTTPAKVHVVAPARFADAKEIADCSEGNQPVIVNLQGADRDLQRRMIDFCSGVTYALSGEMERVADEVFLLTPSNVKVSDEERQRLQDRGLGESLTGSRTAVGIVSSGSRRGRTS